MLAESRLALGLALPLEVLPEQRDFVLVLGGVCRFLGGFSVRIGGAGVAGNSRVCCLPQQVVSFNRRVVGSVLRGELPTSGAFRAATKRHTKRMPTYGPLWGCLLASCWPGPLCGAGVWGGESLETCGCCGGSGTKGCCCVSDP